MKSPGANREERKEGQPGEYRASDRETALVSTSGAWVEHPRGRTEGWGYVGLKGPQREYSRLPAKKEKTQKSVYLSLGHGWKNKNKTLEKFVVIDPSSSGLGL